MSAERGPLRVVVRRGTRYLPAVLVGEPELGAAMVTIRQPGRPAQSVELTSVICAWFAACYSPSVVLVPQPVLGPVPACERCAALAGAR